MKGVTAPSGQVDKVGGEVERNMYGVSGKFKSSFQQGGRRGRREGRRGGRRDPTLKIVSSDK